MTAARLAAMACTLLLICAADAHAAWPTAVNSQITLAPAQDTPLTTVNPQITDAITQTNVKVLGDAPGMAMGQIFATTAGALAIANASSAGQETNIDQQASTTQSVALLYSVDTASTPSAVTAVFRDRCAPYLTAALLVTCAAEAAG